MTTDQPDAGPPTWPNGYVQRAVPHAALVQQVADEQQATADVRLELEAAGATIESLRDDLETARDAQVALEQQLHEADRLHVARTVGRTCHAVRCAEDGFPWPCATHQALHPEEREQ